MASLSLFVMERHSRVWLLRLLIHRSHQSKLPILSGIKLGKTPMVTVLSVNCLKALSFDVKLLKALPNCLVMASLSLFQNECPEVEGLFGHDICLKGRLYTFSTFSAFKIHHSVSLWVKITKKPNSIGRPSCSLRCSRPTYS